jgi:parallel beta-helix repeat protein
VKDFGAKADTTNGADGTDDYPAFMAALDYLRTSSPILTGEELPFRPNGTLYVPPGRYRISQTINLKSTVRILGAGTGGNGGEATKLYFPADTTGIIVNRHNTYGETHGADSSGGSGSAEGSVIEGLMLIGGGGTKGSAKDGFRIRARCEVLRCSARFFTRDGYHLVNTLAQPDPAPLGSTNQNKLSDCTAENNGRHGFCFGGADGNAITVVNPNAVQNGQFGWVDNSFLGVAFVGGHTASNGQANSGLWTDETGIVSHDGTRYFLAYGATNPQGQATTPGTNESVWRFMETGDQHSNYPDWSTWVAAGKTFVNGGAFVLAGGASGHFRAYSEGGQGWAYIGDSACAFSSLLGDNGARVYGNGFHLKANDGYAEFNKPGSFQANGSVIRVGGQEGILAYFDTDLSRWIDLAYPRIRDSNAATSYTLSANDAAAFIRFTAAAATTLTVPVSTTVPFPLGTRIRGQQNGAGAITITPGNGFVNIVAKGLTTTGNGAAFELIKVGGNTWAAIGDLV